ncbi:hypothetical protein TrCOL_g1113 [Triparma columacea]|uniref:Uncharacterized protein n=1 Tax=Triparma columacea TaxID=722753 RepID=A0A9W7G7P2_9STRA|nr:hypothetical protein TrCOL_g1113 [Triparma columacea]
MGWRATGFNRNILYPEVEEDAPQPHRLSSIVGLGFDRAMVGEGGNKRVLFGARISPRKATTRDTRRRESSSAASGWKRGEQQTTSGPRPAAAGGGGRSVCEVREILIRAWCMGEHQTIGNLL